jgi:hypothetical protein
MLSGSFPGLACHFTPGVVVRPGRGGRQPDRLHPRGAVAGSGGTLLDLVIPNNCPLGLAQVRVLRSAPACGGAGTVQSWSRQYFGYFIQG